MITPSLPSVVNLTVSPFLNDQTTPMHFPTEANTDYESAICTYVQESRQIVPAWVNYGEQSSYPMTGFVWHDPEEGPDVVGYTADFPALQNYYESIHPAGVLRQVNVFLQS
ncbi:hypothetical protein FRB99_004544 [Tulasnella sp. 403]|nr:hypothetical protein FRB99_004544 [Tulasnella sp. 403]